jgi:hypothetical protein
MTLSETKENIVSLLENIIKRTELIERQSGSRNLLEIDLAMEDLRLLYRELNLLRKLSENENLAEAPLIRRERKQESRDLPEQPQLKTQEKVSESETNQPIESKAEEETVEGKEEPVAKVETEPAKQSQKPEAEVVPDLKPREEPKMENNSAPKETAETVSQGKPIVGEKFSSEKSSIHERLAQIKDDKSIGARMQYKPVKNIKEAIGINEKFLFINELFNGDLKSYNESVEKLNDFPSIHEAFEFLNKLTYEYQWDGQRSADTIEKFANLVQRRYM